MSWGKSARRAVRYVSSIVAVVATCILALAATAQACDGDCSGDNKVTVDEVVTLIAISVGDLPASACPAMQSTYVDGVVRAVINSLRGCPADSSFLSKFLFPAVQIRLDDRNLLDAVDVNADGLTDVIFANAVWFGKGDGSFLKGKLPMQDGPIVALGDFDGDGKDDAVTTVAHDGGATIDVLNATGEIGSTEIVSAPAAFAAGDVNGDGKLDLIALRQGGTAFSILVGNGGGTFVEQPAVELTGSVALVIAGDLDRDGRSDIVLASATLPEIIVLRSASNGTLETSAFLWLDSEGGALESVKLVDSDLDGILDVLAVDQSASAARLWRGRGDATFDSVTSNVGLTHPLTIVTGDFDDIAGLEVAMASADQAGDVVVLGRSGEVRQQFTVGEPIVAMAAGDVTGDGAVDLMYVGGTINGGGPSSYLSIFEGKGDGTFYAPDSFQTDGSPGILTLADFNRDRLLDAAVWVFETDASSVQIFLRRDDGRLEPIEKLPSGDQSVLWVSADFDGDGAPDLAGGDRGTNDIAVYFGNRDGTFAPRFNTPVAAELRALVAADFNGDERVDLATASDDSGLLTILLSKEGRSFESSTLAYADAPHSLAVGDADNDGDPDLFVAGSRSIAVFLSDGVGGFTAGNRMRFSAEHVFPGKLLSSDLNSDGFPDLITNSGDFELRVFLGSSDGTFRSPRTYPAFDIWGIFGTGDFNRDGFPDVLARDEYSSVSIFLGDGKGRLTGPQKFGVGLALDSVAVGDVNADGVDDLTRLVFLSDGAELGGSGCPPSEPEYVVSYPQRLPGRLGESPVIADFDRNGIPDVALGFQGDSQQAATILIGLGNGEFEAQRNIGEARGVRGVAVADLDADDKLDIVTADQGSATLSIYHGDGAGEFEAAGHITVGKRPMSVAAVDVNRDSRIDLLALDYETKDLSIVLAREDGSYEVTSTLRAGPSSLGPQDVRYLIATADFDGNGTVDLAVPSVDPGIAILMGDGEGGFTPGAPIPVTLGQAYSIQVLDLNEDGIADLASTNARASSISVLLGRGDGTFVLSGRFATRGRPLGFAATDVDGDGNVDLIVGDFDVSNALYVLLGNGDGTFEAALTFPWTNTIADVATADFDGDGLIDVFSTNGPEIWMGFGMRLPCARPRDSYTIVPYEACTLVPEENGQELSCR